MANIISVGNPIFKGVSSHEIKHASADIALQKTLDHKLGGRHRKTAFEFFREIKINKNPRKSFRIEQFRHRVGMDPKYARKTGRFSNMQFTRPMITIPVA